MKHTDERHDEALRAPSRAWPSGTNSPRHWRTLEELSGTPEFEDYLRREFPSQADRWADPDSDSRRHFLRLMGASLALAGVTGCAIQPSEEIVPYVEQPPELLPGHPLEYATTITLGGYAQGVVVKSHEGRPTKIEGNELHPASLGATDALTQAAVLDLYDPDRAQYVLYKGTISSYDTFLGKLTDELNKQHERQGDGLRILTGQITSPTQARLLHTFLEQYPKARWHQHEPVSREAVLEGAKLAFGTDAEPVLDLGKADVIVSFDADFLGRGPGHVAAARDFALRRDPGTGTTMNRLYVAECTPSITGAMADHRQPVSSSAIGDLVAALAVRLGVPGAAASANQPTGELGRWLDGVVHDLSAHKGAGLVIVGEDQPAAVQALGHLINHALGNTGKTVSYIEPVLARATKLEQRGTLADLVAEINAPKQGKKVEVLIVIGGNPVYDAPADLNFAAALDKVRFVAYLGTHGNETAARSPWFIPMAHALESWGDARAFDGTVSIQQPLIAPIFGGRSPIELLAALVGQADRPLSEIVRETWRTDHASDEFEKYWRQAVHDGVIAKSARQPLHVRPRQVRQLPALPHAAEGLTLVFRPDPTIWDGQFANNGWLQELPKPLTKITWDNPVLVSPTTADRLGLKTEDLVTLQYQGRTIEAAVYVLQGHADEVMTLTLGYGRTMGGRNGTGAGFNAYALRTSTALAGNMGLEVKKTGRTYRLATTQVQQVIDQRTSDRELVLVRTLDEYAKNPKVFQEDQPEFDRRMTLMETPDPQRRREENGVGNAWAMVIDLNKCIGCGACVIACQAENNIPVVGKKQVIAGRAMHWVRVDHYFKGDAANPKSYHQPVPCMHCEKAPCELVCPVGATTHSAEGLNEMTYNRCVGTRYCGNNCPYKVRRFNFFQYSDLKTGSLEVLNNPEVTVRTRGIMEKCTYCVQRITAARIAAEEKTGHETVRTADIMTACEQVCPTTAIAFGNLNDTGPDNTVAQGRQSPRHYALLSELNVRPRTTYLAKLTNPNTGVEAE